MRVDRSGVVRARVGSRFGAPVLASPRESRVHERPPDALALTRWVDIPPLDIEDGRAHALLRGRTDRELDEPDRGLALEREEALEGLRLECVVPCDLADFLVEERGIFVVEEFGTHREPGGEGVGLVWANLHHCLPHKQPKELELSNVVSGLANIS